MKVNECMQYKNMVKYVGFGLYYCPPYQNDQYTFFSAKRDFKLILNKQRASFLVKDNSCVNIKITRYTLKSFTYGSSEEPSRVRDQLEALELHTPFATGNFGLVHCTRTG